VIRIVTTSMLALIAILASPKAGNAQDYPSKPIRIVVGYPPGAGIDFTARLFADWLKAALGQPVLVENRAGAGGELAGDYVSRAEPDGYTLMYAVGSDLVWTKFLTRRATIDSLKDLTPIATVISSVNCVAVNSALPIKSFRELVEFTKANPGKLTYGTSGIQSYYYLIGEALRQQGVDMLHVPYKGFEVLHITPLRSIGLAQAIEYARNWSILLHGSPPGSTPIAGTLPGHQG